MNHRGRGGGRGGASSPLGGGRFESKAIFDKVMAMHGGTPSRGSNTWSRPLGFSPGACSDGSSVRAPPCVGSPQNVSDVAPAEHATPRAGETSLAFQRLPTPSHALPRPPTPSPSQPQTFSRPLTPLRAQPCFSSRGPLAPTLGLSNWTGVAARALRLQLAAEEAEALLRQKMLVHDQSAAALQAYARWCFRASSTGSYLPYRPLTFPRLLSPSTTFPRLPSPSPRCLALNATEERNQCRQMREQLEAGERRRVAPPHQRGNGTLHHPSDLQHRRRAPPTPGPQRKLSSDTVLRTMRAAAQSGKARALCTVNSTRCEAIPATEFRRNVGKAQKK